MTSVPVIAVEDPSGNQQRISSWVASTKPGMPDLDSPSRPPEDPEDGAGPGPVDPPRPTARQRLYGFYERNIGIILVFLAQTFGSVVRAIPTLVRKGIFLPGRPPEH
jgi:hypothetical protein